MRRSNSEPRFSRTARPAVSLAIPCYNEEDILRTTVTRLLSAFAARGIALELVLVDNGSRDATGKIIDGMIRSGWPVVKRIVKVNQGYGWGVLTGLSACRAPLIGYTCADSPVDAEDAVRVYEVAAKARRPMLVKICRRFRMDGAFRRFTSWGYQTLAALLYWDLDVVDINGTPKIFPRESLAPLRLGAKGSALDLEILIKARRLGMDVLELSVFDRRREAGASKVNPNTVVEMATNLLRYRVSRR